MGARIKFHTLERTHQRHIRRQNCETEQAQRVGVSRCKTEQSEMSDRDLAADPASNDKGKGGGGAGIRRNDDDREYVTGWRYSARKLRSHPRQCDLI
jgi:hypothetical protein